MNDSPSVYASAPIGSATYLVQQDFETCAVCIEGSNAMKINSKVEANHAVLSGRQTVQYISRMTVYGCVKWSHYYNVMSNEVGSIMGNQFKTQRSVLTNSIRDSSYEGQPPSKTFKSVIGRSANLLAGGAR